MAFSEADTRAKLIDPAIHSCGWSEDLICRETTLGAVEIIAGKARRRSGGRSDYTLRVRVNAESQPVAVALIEAKKDTLPPGHGLDQAKGYLRASQHNVQFVFSSYRNLPHINGEVIETGTGKLLSVQTAAEDGLISGKYLFESGMILYSKLRPYLRKVTIAPCRGVCSTDMLPAYVRP